MNSAAALGPPVQIAYAVPDAVAAAVQWADRFGAGPFVVRRHIAVDDVSYRGRPASFDHTSAYGQWGAVMVELVEVHGPGPDIVSDVVEHGETALHHLAHLVEDLDLAIDQLRDMGCEVAMSAVTAGGTRFVFVDARPVFGHMVELYQRSDRLTRFYAEVAAAAEGWDGAEPVRIS